MEFYSKKTAAVLLILNHLFVSIGLPLYSSVAQAESSMDALSNTMAELKSDVNALPGRNLAESTPIAPEQQKLKPALPALSLSPPLFPTSSPLASPPSLGSFGSGEETKKGDSIDLISQLPSLEGSKNSLSEEKSLFLDDDMKRSREAADNDLRPLEGLKQFWQVMGSDSRSQAGLGVISGIANDMASNALRDWMGQTGNTRIQFNSSGEASADLLLPLWDAPSTLLFSQQGIRVNKERTTWNLGLGIRHYVSDDIMLGINSFYDRDITGNNARFSVGAEAWTHFLKLSANKYQRLTDWHQSPLDAMEDYDERPANGYDLAADAWLPFYPQFGASVKYEKYFGKGVILDNSASPSGLQDSPSAVTTTLNYTPIPLLTFKAGHKSGSSSDNFVGLDINYRLGLSWDEQTDRETVRVMRSLPGARYDFVDRNYNIVMQYRKQNLISLSLPSSITAEAASTAVITASVRAKYGLKKIDWRAPELLAAGGTLAPDSATSLAVRLPKYHHDGVNSYTVSAIATDNHGNESPESTVVINLVPSSTIVTLEVKPADNIVANGVDTANLHAKVTGKSGELLSDYNVRFVVSGIDKSCILKGNNVCESLHITDTSGMATVPLASTRAGKVTIFSHLDNGNRDSKTLNFIADSTTAELAELTIVVNNAVANGKAANRANVIVADYYGNPISNAAVTFAVSGVANLSTTSAVTDSNGLATVDLTSKLAGNVMLTASAIGMSKSADLAFIADIRTAKIDELFATPARELKADGSDTTMLTAVVKDANGNSVSGASVIFSATAGAKLSQKSVITDVDGIAKVNITSTVAGSSTVSAVTAEDKLGKKVAISFIGDISTAKIDRITASPASGLKADGNESSALTTRVTDAHGNTVNGATVTFTVNGKASLSQPSAPTGSDGTVTVYLTSTSASSSIVTASTLFDTVGKQASVSFAADVATASIESFTASPAVDVKANGSAISTLSAQVKDSNGNLVNGAEVFFNVTGSGKLSRTSVMTDNGIATVQFTSTKAETSTVTAITDFDTAGKQASVTFIADLATAKIASLTASPASEVKADGTTRSAITAQVSDANGNLVNGAEVFFSVKGKGKLTKPSATSVNGIATVYLTSTLAESTTVLAVTEFDTRGKQADVSFVADSATAKIDSLTASRISNVKADGNDKSALTVTVKDANGNLVNNAKVLFRVAGKGQLSQSSATTKDGIATVHLTSTTADISTVTATTDFDASGKQASVSFIADTATAKIDSLTASRISDVKANGSDSSELKATVKDAHGNLVSGAKVFFSLTGKGKLSQASASTVNGIATVTLTSVIADSNTVTAITDADNKGKQASISFIADVSTAKIDELSASRTSEVKANGTDSSVLSATVKDANGNLVSGAEVYFSVTTGKGKLSQMSASSLNGIATVQLTSLIAASNTVTATTNVDQLGKQTSVSFMADMATAKIDSFTASRVANVKANGSDSSLLTATVKDNNGNLVNGAKVLFSVKGKGQLGQASATTLNGIATVQLTSLKAESSTVIAVTEFDSTGKEASVSFIADLATAKIDSLTASPATNVKANGVDSSAVTATVKDTNGNLVSGANVSFRVQGSASLSGLSATTNSAGLATVNLTSLTAQSSTVIAVTEFDKTGKQASVSFIADIATAKVDNLTAFPDTAQANGRSTIKLQATVKDINGNLVNGAAVTFTAPGGAKLSSSSATTTADGKITVELTHITAGKTTVTATTAYDKTGKQATVTFVADAETAAIASFTATPASGIKANGKATATLAVTVKDANGNTVNNEVVTFSVTGKAVLSQTSIRTDSNGNAKVSVTSTSADSSSITAATAYDTSGKQVSVSFIADIATAAIDSLTASRLDNVKANGSDSSALKATVRDANGNLVSGANVLFSVKGNGKVSQTSVTTKEGIATVQLTSLTADSSTVIAVTDFDKTGKQAAVSFIADPATATIDSLIASRTSDVKANGTDSSALKATVKDANGNLVNGVKVFFSVKGNGKLNQTSATTVDGLASVQLTSLIADSSTVSAITEFDKTGKQAAVSFIADPATAKIDSLTASRSSGVKANGIDSSALKATVRDANGNLVSGANVLFSVKGNGKVSQASATSQEGIATVQLTSLIADSSTVTAITDFDKTGKQAAVSFIADPATATIDSLVASREDNVKANGSDSSALTVTVKDANGNLIDGAQVVFNVKGNGQLSQASATTKEGIATVNLTNLKADSSIVTATTDFDKTGKQASVSFIADDATAKIASFTASPAAGTAANGKDYSVLTAVVKDANDNPVGNTSVFLDLSGNAQFGDLPAPKFIVKTNEAGGANKVIFTDKNGTAKVALASTVADSVTVTAFTNYDSTGKQVSVAFVADKNTAAVTSFTASPITNVLTDGSSYSTLTAAVSDIHGNAIEGIEVNFILSGLLSGTATLSELSAVTNRTGKVEVKLSSKLAGNVTINAVTEQDKIGKKAFVTFIANKATAKVVGVTATPPEKVPANGVTASKITALVQDENGNSVVDVEVTFDVIGSAKLNKLSVITDSNGFAIVDLTSQSAGSSTVTAHTDYDKTVHQASVIFVGDLATAKVDSLIASPAEGVAANGVDLSAVTAQVTDANNNPLADAEVTFKMAGRSLIQKAITDSTGRATSAFRSTVAGTMSVTATIENSDNVGKKVDVTYVGDVKTAVVNSLVASPTEGISADGKALSTLNAVIKDTESNLVKGATVTFKVAGTALLSELTAVTDDQGRATVSLTSTTEGSNTVTATTGNDQTGKSVTVGFVAGAVSASTSTLTVTKNILPADGKSSLSLTLTAKDQFGNKSQGARISFNIANLEGVKLSPVTEKEGVYTATLTSGSKAGIGTLSVIQNETPVQDLIAEVGLYSTNLILVVN